MKEMIDKWYIPYTTTVFNEEQRIEFMKDVEYYNLDVVDVLNEIYAKYMKSKGVDVNRDISTNK